MKVLLLTNYFPPEIGAASHLFYDLGKTLIKKGYGVTVVTGFPRYNVDVVDNRYKNKLFHRETIDGISVFRVPIFPFLKRSLFIRKIEYIFVPDWLFLGGLIVGEHDVAILYSPPITIGLAGYLLKKTRKIPFILNVQDIHPRALVDIGFLRSKLLIWILKLIEKFSYRNAGFITVHSDGNREYLAKQGVDSKKLIVVHNWVDTEVIRPLPRMNNLRKEYHLGYNFVVSFAGIMGTSQDLITVIKAAYLLRNHNKIKFFLIGDGVEKPNLVKEVNKKNLSNVVFAPTQPREKYPFVLATSDVSLVTLKKSVVTPVVPSKLLSIMASGRPVIASLNLRGDAPEIIRGARCGLVVEPENPKRLADAVLRFYNNSELCNAMGVNGRKYAVENFSLQVCISKYEELFRKVIAK